jgi:hypothetical protein
MIAHDYALEQAINARLVRGSVSLYSMQNAFGLVYSYGHRHHTVEQDYPFDARPRGSCPATSTPSRTRVDGASSSRGHAFDKRSVDAIRDQKQQCKPFYLRRFLN